MAPEPEPTVETVKDFWEDHVNNEYYTDAARASDEYFREIEERGEHRPNDTGPLSGGEGQVCALRRSLTRQVEELVPHVRVLGELAAPHDGARLRMELAHAAHLRAQVRCLEMHRDAMELCLEIYGAGDDQSILLPTGSSCAGLVRRRDIGLHERGPDAAEEHRGREKEEAFHRPSALHQLPTSSVDVTTA